MNSGKPVSERDERIRGALKFKWAVGASKGENLRLVQPLSPLSVTEQETQLQNLAKPGETKKQTKERIEEKSRVELDQRLFNEAIEQAAKEVNANA